MLDTGVMKVWMEEGSGGREGGGEKLKPICFCMWYQFDMGACRSFTGFANAVCLDWGTVRKCSREGGGETSTKGWEGKLKGDRPSLLPRKHAMKASSPCKQLPSIGPCQVISLVGWPKLVKAFFFFFTEVLQAF